MNKQTEHSSFIPAPHRPVIVCAAERERGPRERSASSCTAAGRTTSVVAHVCCSRSGAPCSTGGSECAGVSAHSSQMTGVELRAAGRSAEAPRERWSR